MFRYFLNFSYIGTPFRGVQRVVNRSEADPRDIHSVQGVIELALRRLRPVNEIDSAISSRTDAGVHALNTTLHVDLERADKKAYNPQYITSYLNSSFFRYEIPIRINETYLIPPDLNHFHCRFSATGRTYLYRLAILKPSKDTGDDPKSHFIPIEETDRCFFSQISHFNLDAVHSVVPLFEGVHDFRTFMNLNPSNRQKHCMYTIRTINSIKITEGRSQASLFNRHIADEHYNYFDILVSGRSFLYRQVRRIVATLLAVAQEKLTRKDVYEMITIPSTNSWPNKVKIVPASGLYLCEVRYRPEEIEIIKQYNESIRGTNSRKKKEIEAL